MKNLFYKLKTSLSSNLSHTTRYSGKFLIKSESVADHIVSMIGMGLVITTELNSVVEDPKDLIDRKEVLYRISIHDLDESVSFDLPRNYKYDNARILEAVEFTNGKLLRANYPEDIVEDIENAKDRKTKEGLIVAILDSFQAYCKIDTESKLGNSLLRSELNNFYPIIEDYQNIVRDTPYTKDQKDILMRFLSTWTTNLTE